MRQFNAIILSLVLACFCFITISQGASVRRGDKISEHFKQLDLPPEEIDPNVAPIDDDNNKIDIAENEIIDDLEDQANAVAAMEEAEALQQAQQLQAQSVEAAVTPATSVQSVASNVETVTSAPIAATTAAPVKLEENEPTGLAKYCKCSGNHCDCCRNFNLPFVPVKGPGCARMSYLGNEKMSVSLKYGDLTLITRTVSSKRARPICVGLPGGYSQFCGRVYGLSKAKENFKACLGFELRADDEVEAALRVSCFKFGPEGLRVAEAEPLPSETVKDDDDDDDIFGFAAGGDDDDDDDYEDENDDEEEEEAEDDGESETEYADDDDDNEEAPVDADYGGFSLAGLLEELDDDDDDDSKPSKPATTAVAPTSDIVAAATAAATSAPAEATRTAETLQSKDDKGTEATQIPLENAGESESTDNVTPAAEAVSSDTTPKGKKTKKSKKGKKKKAAEDTESDFAFEILNGLLDFFN